jgi:Domain of unknown function (DUF6265)
VTESNRVQQTRGAGITSTLLLAGLALAIVGPGAGRAAEPQATLSDLAWMTGSWVKTTGATRIEEQWLAPASHLMLGMSRTAKQGSRATFEFLRIEERPAGIYYVAQPGGRPPTDFKLTRRSGEEAVFENPRHDYPRLIQYRRNADGTLLAHLEGVVKGQHLEESILSEPVASTHP